MPRFALPLALALALVLPAAAHADGPASGLIPGRFPTAPADLARLPADGVYIVSKLDAYVAAPLLIHRLDQTGFHKVYEDSDSAAYTAIFTDPTTLWVIAQTPEGATPGIILTRFERGVPDAPRTLPLAAFPVTPHPDYPFIDLAAGPRGDLSLVVCPDYDVMRKKRCKKEHFFTLAADDDDGVRPAKAPTKAFRALAGNDSALPTKRKVPAPAGYKLVKRTVDNVPGLACTTPSGETTLWPGPDGNRNFQVQPRTLTWVSQVPPLVLLEGRQDDPLGSNPRGRDVLRACSDQAYFRFRWLGPDLWAAMESPFGATAREPSQWFIHLGDQHIATVAADFFFYVPTR